MAIAVVITDHKVAVCTTSLLPPYKIERGETEATVVLSVPDLTTYSIWSPKHQIYYTGWKLEDWTQSWFRWYEWWWKRGTWQCSSRQEFSDTAYIASLFSYADLVVYIIAISLKLPVLQFLQPLVTLLQYSETLVHLQLCC